MIRYEHDHHGFGSAVELLKEHQQYGPRTAYDICQRLEECRALMGPYQAPPGKGRLHRAFTFLLNKLFWRQHTFNQNVLRGLQDALMLLPEIGRNAPDRPMIAVLVPYDIAENTTGGSSRLWGLCEALAEYYRIQVLTVVRWWKTPERKVIYPGVELFSFPMPAPVENEIERNAARLGNASPFLSMIDPANAFASLDGYLARMGPQYRAVIMDSPYLFDRLRKACPSVPLIYETPNVNIEFFGRMAGDKRDVAIPLLKEVEARAIADARSILCVCDRDRDVLVGHYPAARGKIHVVPNGVAVSHAYRVRPSESIRLAKLYNMNTPAVLFVGSVLEANIRAMEFIVGRLATSRPHVLWVIVGITRKQYAECGGKGTIPANVLFTGRITESEKEAVMALCRLAIAPMEIGTGSSLKIPDYIAHGKPVVATEIGLRGFEYLAGAVDVVALDGVASAVGRRLDELEKDPAALDAREADAFEIVRRNLDWPVMARQVQALVEASVS